MCETVRVCSDKSFSLLQGLQPHLRTYNLKEGSLKFLRGRVTRKLEEKYRVAIVPVTQGEEECVTIHALTDDEGGQCWKELEKHINTNLIISDTFSVSYIQARYLEAKHSCELEEIRRKRIELSMPQPSDKNGKSDIRIKGTVNQVSKTIAKLKNWIEVGYAETQFDVQISSFYSSMWNKRWQHIKQEQEALHSIVIEFKQQIPCPGASDGDGLQVSDTVTFTFVMCGESKAIEGIKTAICTKESGDCIERRVVKLPPGGVAVISKELEQIQVSLCTLVVEIIINEPFNTVTISAPREVLGDLNKAEEIVLSYVKKKQTISLTDPIISLILASPMYCSKMGSIIQPVGVRVNVPKYPNKELTLIGIQSTLQQVLPNIQQLLTSTLQDIDQISVVIDSHHDSIVDSKEFVRFCEALQDELYVTCTRGYKKHNRVVIKPMIVQPSQSPHCVKLEIVQGNIINEHVGAIVNNSNESLQHTEGLAKLLSDAGGPAIQSDSDEYIRTHGKLNLGDAVCLGGGSLLCRRLIHVVWPHLEPTKPAGEQVLVLRSSIIKVLNLAEEEKVDSVSLSVTGMGVVDIPSDVCAQALLEALKMFHCSNVHKVRCVLPDSPSKVDEFISALRLVCPEHFVEQEKKGTAQANVEEVKEVSGRGKNKRDVQSRGCVQPLSDPSQTWISYFYNVWLAIKGEERSTQTLDRKDDRRRLATQQAEPQYWLWQDDSGSFLPYNSYICMELSQEYAKHPKGSTSCFIGEHHYIVDFASMTQTNVTTKKRRNIQCGMSVPIANAVSPVKAQVAQWYYQEEDGHFTPYTPQDSGAIQSMYETKVPAVLTINNNSYKFDFGSMSQINVKTNRKHPIKQQILNEVSCLTTNSKDGETIITLLLRGLKENLPSAKLRIHSMLESAYTVKSVTLPPGDQHQLVRKLEEIAKQYQVSTSVSGGRRASKEFKVEGLSSAVLKAVTALQEEIIRCQGLSEEANFPPEWQPQSETTQLFPLTEWTDEWNHVAGMFQKTMPRARITAIKRIQNTWLWDRYVKHRERLKLKNSGRANEMELFHGTSNNDPKLIYEGEDGFDMRYSAQGMWGVANYFAVNASYSHQYAHVKGWMKEMFLVKVLTGDSCSCAPNSTLRVPPPKPSGMAGGALKLEQLKYDSVTGTTNGSQVFMTYDNEKAYPAYLITYN